MAAAGGDTCKLRVLVLSAVQLAKKEYAATEPMQL